MAPERPWAKVTPNFGLKELLCPLKNQNTYSKQNSQNFLVTIVWLYTLQRGWFSD